MSLFAEEMCEMLGIVVLIYTLLCYIAEERIGIRLGATVPEGRATAPVPAEAEREPMLGEASS